MVHIIGFAILICLGVLIVWCMYTFNKFKEQQTMIDFWWDEVDAHLQLRRELVPGVIDKARPVMLEQKAVFDSMADVREKIIHELIFPDAFVGGQNLEHLENRLTEEISALTTAFRNHRDAQMNPELIIVMSEMTSIEGKAFTACAEYNKLTAGFNSSIKSFPANIVAGILKFHPLEKRICGSTGR